jgi:hypothetical protein
MSTRNTPELALADSGLRCDTFNFICTPAESSVFGAVTQAFGAAARLT